MRQMFREIGEFTPDKLIAGNVHPIDTRAVVLMAGTGVLKRGTLISSTGEICSSKTDIPIGILCDDVELGEKLIETVMYVCGDFKASEVIVASTTTETQTVEGVETTTETETGLTANDFALELQKLGIFLK